MRCRVKDKKFFCILSALLCMMSAAPLSSGQFYLLEDTTRNYSQSVQSCQELGFDGLAVVNSKPLLDTVLGQLKYPRTQQYWIGMHYSVRKQHHVWDTGVDVTWSAWNVNEPDNMPQDKCVRIRTTLNFGTWNCAEKFMAVCAKYAMVSNELEISSRMTVSFVDALWRGAALSLLDCVRRCMGDILCQHIVFDDKHQSCVKLTRDYMAISGSHASVNGFMVSKEETN